MDEMCSLVIFCLGSVGAPGCQHRDSRVITPRGILSAEIAYTHTEVSPRHTQLSWAPHGEKPPSPRNQYGGFKRHVPNGQSFYCFYRDRFLFSGAIRISS